MSRGPVAVAFFGSGPFALPILDRLAGMPAVRVVGVVTVPDRPSGRGGRLTAPPVADRARALGVSLHQPARLRDGAAASLIRDLGPEVAVLADYGRLVPPELLAIPRRGFLNLHPSLLPRHRGATPIPATILSGDREAGVSLFEMDSGLDTGPIVAQARWPLTGREDAMALEADAALRAAELLEATLSPWLAGERPARPQPAAGMTVTRALRREDGRLDPALPAVELERRVRAFVPWPGTFVDLPDGRLAILRAAAAPSQPGDEPGLLVADDGGVALTAADSRLRLLEVRPAGGRTMSAADLRNGHPGWLGARVAHA
ncbi:MAG: methionyl-tRNA formyltransferase [Chloroflexi bacterium]|nr:methionyl-tRNA formyltransferase [Chloroflexota bacterium]